MTSPLGSVFGSALTTFGLRSSITRAISLPTHSSDSLTPLLPPTPTYIKSAGSRSRGWMLSGFMGDVSLLSAMRA